MDISNLAGLLAPSEDEKKQANLMGLLGMGLGILQNNTGNFGRFGPAIGAGGMQGLNMQQQALQNARNERRSSLQDTITFGNLQRQQAKDAQFNSFIDTIKDPAEKARALIDPKGFFAANDIKYQDLGHVIAVVRNGQIIGTLPKSATPDAQLRESGENSRYDRVSANTASTNQTSRLNNAATVGASIYGTNVGAQTARDRLNFDADPSRQAALAGARTAATEGAKNTVAAQEALPSVQSKAAAVAQNIKGMIGSLDVGPDGKLMKSAPGQEVIQPHPGFRSFVGSAVPVFDGMAVPGLKYIPGSNTADYKARHDQLKGTVFLEAYQMLKGGGQITEIEGKKAESAMSRMDSAQSEVEYVRAAREFNQAVQAGARKLEQRASQSNGWSVVR